MAAQQADTVTPYQPSFFAEYRPNTAFDMIGRLPGFAFDGGSSERGFAGTAGNVLIDGKRPPSRGDSLHSILTRIPAASIVRIDLIQGGAPGIDMQGRTLVANVILRPDPGARGSAYAFLDSDENNGFERIAELQARRQRGGGNLEGSLVFENFADFNQNRRTRFRPDGVVTEQSVDDNHFEVETVRASGSAELLVFGGRLRANAQVGYEEGDFGGFETLLIPGGAIVYGGGNDRVFGEAGLRYARNAAGGFDLELVGFHSQNHNTSMGETAFPDFRSGQISDTSNGEDILSATLHSPAYGAWKFDAGTEAAFNWSEADLLRTVDGVLLSLAGDQSRVEELRYDSRLVATWRPSPAFNLDAGVRYERSTISAGPVEKTLGYVKPRLNLSWTPKPGHQIGLRIERTVDQLSFGAFQSSASFSSTYGDTILGIGNNELTPAHQWIYEIRYERRWAREGVASLRVTHRRIDDYVSRIVIPSPTPTNPGRTFEINANVGKAEGTTMVASLAVPLEPFGIRGGLFRADVTLRDSELADPVQTGLRREISGEEPVSWHLNYTQNLPAKNLTISLDAVDGGTWRDYAPRSTKDYEGEFRLRLDVTWRPRPELTFTGGVKNITKAEAKRDYVFYSAPRGTGSPLYTEAIRLDSARALFFSIRRTLK